jgi:hypothetical protein
VPPFRDDARCRQAAERPALSSAPRFMFKITAFGVEGAPFGWEAARQETTINLLTHRGERIPGNRAISRHERNIRIIGKSIFPLFIAIGGFGCTESDRCGEFPNSLSSTSAEAPGVTETDRTSESVGRAIAEIDLCYASTEYSETDYKKSFHHAWLGQDGNYYIIFDFVGVEDKWLVFRADQDGRVNSAFLYSPLSAFRVPR